MAEELLKNLLRLKIAAAHKVMDRLPERVQRPLKEFETELLQVIYEVSKECSEQTPASDNSPQAGGLKSIDIM